MTILEKQSLSINDFSIDTFVTTKQLSKILDGTEFQQDLLKLYEINIDKPQVLKIGNSKQLLTAITNLDNQCEKIDIVSKIKDIQLKALLDEEKAIFEIFNIVENSILIKNESDLLLAETRYSAKTDILDYYNFSKFANYCRDQEYKDLIDIIKGYLKTKNLNNEEPKKLRLVYKKNDKKFYLRAVTSSSDYKNFGINFSVFVALFSLNEYVERTKNEIFINRYIVDDSTIYVSFALKNKMKVSSQLNLSLNLILENDEVKRNSVSFNGIFKLEYSDRNKQSEIYLKPKGYVRDNSNYPTDLLTYAHRGNVENVLEKIKELPKLINYYIEQVSNDAEKICTIQNADEIRKFIADKVRFSKKPEFKEYKARVFNKLMSITVDNTFKLFDLLRQVEELFDHEDIISRDYWRGKLYEALIEKK